MTESNDGLSNDGGCLRGARPLLPAPRRPRAPPIHNIQLYSSETILGQPVNIDYYD